MKLQFTHSSSGAIDGPFQVDLINDSGKCKLASEVLVKYLLELDERSFGIKDIITSVDNIQFSVEKDGEKKTYVYTSTLPEMFVSGENGGIYEKGWNVQCSWSAKKGGPGIGIHAIDIDLDNKDVTIFFFH